MNNEINRQPVLVRDIMTRDIICVTADTPVGEIARLLNKYNISGTPVVESCEEGKIIGIITEEDLIMRDALVEMPNMLSLFDSIFFMDTADTKKPEIGEILATKAGELMTHQVVSVTETDTVRYLANLMMKRAVNPVPVVNAEGLLCGIVSRADIIRLMVNEGV
jgi:CBS domain-containing protein